MKKILMVAALAALTAAGSFGYELRKGKDVVFDNVKSVTVINLTPYFGTYSSADHEYFTYWEITLEDGTVYTTFDGDFFTDAPVHKTNADVKFGGKKKQK